MDTVETLASNESLAYFMGFFSNEVIKKYPVWRYHKVLDPVLVENTEQDDKLKEIGYGQFEIPLTANDYLVNWYWDLEDMSPKQLVVFAKEEYGVDFPVEAKQEYLFKAVLELSKNAPQSRNRIAFMAQSVQMNYDETLLTIRKMAENASDVETYTVEL